MAQGAFTLNYDTDTGIIDFQVKAGTGSTPEDQAALMIDIERVVATLNRLKPVIGQRYGRYFEDTCSLASAGLVGPDAQPQIASRALASLKDEIVHNEAGTIKNRHLLNLGGWALLYAVLGVALGIVGSSLAQYSQLQHVNTALFAQFCYAWAGAMAGTWLSFGYRKAKFTFEDLSKPEADYLWSSIRLIFTGLQTIVIGLLLSLNVVKIDLGGMSTSQFATSVEAAVLIGMLCGFSEQTLPTTIAQQAANLLKSSAPKSS